MTLKDELIDELKEYFYSRDPNISEGENFIADYFRDEDIKIIKQKQIPFLDGDSKEFRQADFYLPKYKLYLEFLGYWSVSKESRNEYIQKMKIYSANNIACVYIYPDNLGIFEHIFNSRAKKTLKDNNLKWELFQFRKYLFLKNKGDIFFWLGISLLIMIFTDYQKISEASTRNSIVFFSGIIIYQGIRLVAGIIKYFFND